jgi:hypothetical protein
MANLAVEFHDSSLARVRWIAGDALLEIHVFVHRSDGRPGSDDGDGWFQDAEVVLYEARIAEQPSGGSLNIMDGSARIGGELFENVLPLPCDVRADVEISFSGAAGILVATAKGLSLTLKGEPGPIEEFKR